MQRGAWSVERRRKRNGFTLLEIMLSVAIMAVIMLAVYGVVVTTVQAQEQIEEITIGTEVGPVILNQIRQDLEAAFLPDTKTEWFVGVDRQGSNGGRDRFDFVSAVTELGSETPESEPKFHSVNELGYSAEENPHHSGELILYRRQDPFIDEAPLKGGHLTALYDHVISFDVQYWNGTEWLMSWASQSQDKKLPKAVKVELKISMADRKTATGMSQRTYALTVVPPR